MMCWKNQKGVTLVELLGALTLVFIVALGIFFVLTHHLNLFQREVNRIDVRGQANIMANQLTTFYQENGYFEIETIKNGVRVKSGSATREYFLPGHVITIETELPITTQQFNKMEVTITITGGDERFILETVVSRLKEEI